MQKVYDLRHTHTKYNHLGAFYNVNPGALQELDAVCTDFAAGRIVEDEFTAKVKEIEAKVDLAKKSNKRKYIKDIVDKMLASGGVGEKEAARVAEANLRDVIKRNQRFIIEKKRQQAQRGDP